jgi:hypothetical protein
MSKIKFVIVVFLASFAIVALNFRFMQMAGGDQSLFIDPGFLWKTITFSWDSGFFNLLGWSNLSIQAAMPLVVFFKLLNFLPVAIVEHLYFAIVFTLIFLSSFYYFYNYLFEKNQFISAAASLFYVLNPFFFVSYSNYNLHLAFIVFPLLFILGHKIIEGNIKKTIIIVFLISIFVPAVFSNPPCAIPLFIASFCYFLFLIFNTKTKKDPKLFLNIIVSGIFFILINSWWMLPFLYSILKTSFVGDIGSLNLSVFNTQSLHDAFRMMGAWHFGKYYLGFKDYKVEYLYVENPVFIFSTYLLVAVSYCSLFFIKKNRNILFFAALSMAGIFLIKGELKPLGELYTFLFHKVPGMQMFREPFTKFMLIHVFSVCILLGYALRYSCDKIINKTKVLILLIILLIPSVPFILGGFTPKGEFASIRSYLVKKPQYLDDFKGYESNKKLDYKILSTPRIASSYIWESGFDINNSVLKHFSEKPIISYQFPVMDYFAPGSDYFCDSLFGSLEKNEKAAANYLGTANTGEIVQENSRDWRWSETLKSPSQMEKILDNFASNNLIYPEKQFGSFDEDNLSRINPGISDKEKSGKLPTAKKKEELLKEFKKELLNRPAISLYKVQSDNFIPHIYAPSKIFYSKRPNEEIRKLFSSDQLDINSAVFFQNQNVDNAGQLDYFDKNSFKNEGIKSPVIEFKKIDPAKYRIVIHGASEKFPLIFSESYHDGWKIYAVQDSIRQPADKVQSNLNKYKILDGNKDDQSNGDELEQYIENGWISTLGDGKERKINHNKWENGLKITDYIEKYSVDFVSKNFKNTIQNDNLANGNIFETWLKNPIDGNQKHLVANGYANSWLIDPEKMCAQGDNCSKNSDGSYNFEMVMEFWPQRIFYMGFFVSGMAFLACLGYLIYDWKRGKNKIKELRLAEKYEKGN